MMKKNKVLMLAGTIAVSGVVLLNGDVSVAADTTGVTTVTTAATSNYQNGTYTATAALYKSGTAVSSLMSNMVNSQADVTIKNQTATITLTFGKLSNADMVKSWAIDGVEATQSGQAFTVAIPVVDLSKTLQSTIHIETVIGSVPFSETQPVDLTVTDLKLVARDPDEVAAEQAAAEKVAADKAAADKAAADNPSNPSNLPNNYVLPNQATGHDVPLTAQLSNTLNLPNTAATNTATKETTTALLLAALVSGVLALGIWLKKILR